MARLDEYSDDAFASLLAAVPEEYREHLMEKRKTKSEPMTYPEGYKRSDGAAGAGAAYARIRTAPMCWMTFRRDPVHVEIRGLTSARGQAMNGLCAYVVARVREVGGRADKATDRLRVVYLEREALPRTAALARAHPDARHANLKVENLRLRRCAARGDPPEARTLLSALAGDVLERMLPDRGFFVFYPGLRRGPKDARAHPALRLDAARLGSWGSHAPQDQKKQEAAMKARLRELKQKEGLPSGAWDPLEGPGWPGVYADRRAAGCREAAQEDVVECESLAKALELWDAVAAGAEHFSTIRKQPPEPAYFTPLRCVLPPGVNDEAFEAFVTWLINAAPAGRDEAVNDVGLGVTCTTVLEEGGRRTGVALFATQGHFAPGDFLQTFGAADADFCATLDGVRVALEPGRDAFRPGEAPVAPRERPPTREWQALLVSECGRFTFSSWWQNGANAAEGELEYEADPGVEEAKE